MREHLAELAHQRWSRWMDFMSSRCELNEDGTATIPSGLVERWRRQVATHYSELSEQEKDSDRIEADRIISIITGWGAFDTLRQKKEEV